MFSTVAVVTQLCKRFTSTETSSLVCVTIHCSPPSNALSWVRSLSVTGDVSSFERLDSSFTSSISARYSSWCWIMEPSGCCSIITPHCLNGLSSQGVHLNAAKSVSMVVFHSGPSSPAIRKSSTCAPMIPICSPVLPQKVHTQGSAEVCLPPSSCRTLSTWAYHSRGAVVSP